MRTLTQLRHRYPILRRGRFLTGEFDEALGVQRRDLDQRQRRGDAPEDWQDGNLRCFGDADGRPRAGDRHPPPRARDTTLLMVLNAYHDVVNFTLPPCAGGSAWLMVFDTNIPEDAREQRFRIGDAYDVTGRSVVLFQLMDGDGPHPQAKG